MAAARARQRAMIATLLRQDLRQLSRERALALALAIALAAVAYATWSGSRWKAERLDEIAAAAGERSRSYAAELAQLEGLARGDLDIAEVGGAGLPNAVETTYLLPPGALAALSIGDADLRPAKATITAVSRATDMFRFYQVDNPALLALGRFDLAFVVVYLLPLLIIGMNYGVLAADRETGALALLLSQPLTAARVAWTRIGLRSGIVAAAVVVGGICGWLLFTPDPFATPPLLRLLLWSGVVFAYGAFWAALSGLVASGERGSDGNALLLLLCWAVVTFLLPSLISVCAQVLSPTPSRLAYVTTARAAENAANREGPALVRSFLMDHPELEIEEQSAVAPFVKTYVLVQQRVDAAVAPITTAFEQRLDRQQALGGALSWLSPASLTRGTLARIAGSGLDRHRRFEAEAQSLRRRWLAALEAPIVAGRRLSAREFSELPRPAFHDTTAASVARRTAAPVAALLVYAGLLAALAQWRFRRRGSGASS